MKIPVFILSAFVTAALAMQAWTLNEVVTLKADVAAINAKLSVNFAAK